MRRHEATDSGLSSVGIFSAMPNLLVSFRGILLTFNSEDLWIKPTFWCNQTVELNLHPHFVAEKTLRKCQYSLSIPVRRT